jgi:uncharacterized protein with PQ loop repeat
MFETHCLWAVTPADAALAMFTVCNTLRVVAYVPQIVKIGRDRQGALAISYSSWTLFGVSNLSTALYGVLVVQDWRLSATFGASALCCLAILVMTAWKRIAFAQAAPRIAPQADAVLETEARTAAPQRQTAGVWRAYRARATPLRIAAGKTG